MPVVQNMYRHKLVRLLDELPDFQLREVYHFTVFLKEHFADELQETDTPSVRVDHINSMLGLIAVGGDAVQDTEEVEIRR